MGSLRCFCTVSIFTLFLVNFTWYPVRKNRAYTEIINSLKEEPSMKRVRKLSPVMVLAGISLLVFLSCSQGLLSTDVQDSQDKTDGGERAIVTLAITSISPANSSTNISIAESLAISCNTTVDSSSINTIQITLTDNLGKNYEGRTTVDSTKTKILFTPIFKAIPTGSGAEATILFSGPKQASTYTYSISGYLKATNGNTLSMNHSISYTTSNLDFGIWWFNEHGEAEKFIAGKPNSNYDPQKQTVLFVHGWEKDSVTNNYWRESPYFWNNKYVSNLNLGAIWKQKGYNIGAFYWNQFADEGEVKDAEAKVWKGNNGLKNMRYKLSNGTYVSYSTTKSITDLFYDDYLAALQNNTSGNIRIVGHSLGNQLATSVAYKLGLAIKKGSLPSYYMPSRIALNDAFWSTGNKSYLSNKWTGAEARTQVDYLIKNFGVVVEQSKSSALGGLLVGDDNVDMRKKTAFYRIWPEFMPLKDSAFQHGYANLWYFWSIGGSIQTENGDLGAAASNASIASMMNYGKSTLFQWYNTGTGNNTASPLDDTFIRKSGVSTW